MFSQFEKHFKARPRFGWRFRKKRTPLELFRAKYAGKDFGDGIYRVFAQEEIEPWRERITEAYPRVEKQFEPFGYDWMGRCFAIDLRTGDHILLFEIGEGTVLDIPVDFVTFHNEEIPNEHEACLASELFEQWRSGHMATLPHENCIGYEMPLFLGGKEQLKNLGEVDMEDYWNTIGSLL